LKLEILGAALSLTITHYTNLIILDKWIGSREDFKETWIKHDERSKTEWGPYFKVGIFGALLECLGWWNLHICFLFSGYLGVNQIAA
jgi:Na+-driven multidrug efflux pump